MACLLLQLPDCVQHEGILRELQKMFAFLQVSALWCCTVLRCLMRPVGGGGGGGGGWDTEGAAEDVCLPAGKCAVVLHCPQASHLFGEGGGNTEGASEDVCLPAGKCAVVLHCPQVSHETCWGWGRGRGY